MKKIIAIVAFASFAASCNSSSDKKTGKDTTIVTPDTKVVAPSAPTDTTAVPVVDTTTPTNTGDTSVPSGM